ncbi:MAG: hypothetical protein AAF715_19455 [Myxococcota bacterium]
MRDKPTKEQMLKFLDTELATICEGAPPEIKEDVPHVMIQIATQILIRRHGPEVAQARISAIYAKIAVHMTAQGTGEGEQA